MTDSINGVIVKNITKHYDKRGFFAEILRADDDCFKTIKQTSFSETKPGVIKAFHSHKKQDDIMFVAKGSVQIVLCDLRQGSVTNGNIRVIMAGEDNSILVFIPRGVAHGYKALGKKKVIVFYHTTEVYDADDPDEHRMPHDTEIINFDWDSSEGIK